MLSEGGPGPISNRADNLLNLALADIVVKALWARINYSLVHMWPPALGLPTSALLCWVKIIRKTKEISLLKMRSINVLE